MVTKEQIDLFVKFSELVNKTLEETLKDRQSKYPDSHYNLMQKDWVMKYLQSKKNLEAICKIFVEAQGGFGSASITPEEGGEPIKIKKKQFTAVEKGLQILVKYSPKSVKDQRNQFTKNLGEIALEKNSVGETIKDLFKISGIDEKKLEEIMVTARAEDYKSQLEEVKRKNEDHISEMNKVSLNSIVMEYIRYDVHIPKATQEILMHRFKDICNDPNATNYLKKLCFGMQKNKDVDKEFVTKLQSEILRVATLESYSHSTEENNKTINKTVLDSLKEIVEAAKSITEPDNISKIKKDLPMFEGQTDEYIKNQVSLVMNAAEMAKIILEQAYKLNPIEQSTGEKKENQETSKSKGKEANIEKEQGKFKL